MIIDDLYATRYYIVNDEAMIANGWKQGWQHFDRTGSPKICMDPIRTDNRHRVGTHRIAKRDVWPDTKDYDQNSPGILALEEDLYNRKFTDELDQAFWVNVLRVPVCVAYLAACAKVKPETILELGTGGDSAHSTGMFLHWLKDRPGAMHVSVDRHPLSHVWPRYRENKFWHFIQGDSVTVMKALMVRQMPLPVRYDMIFIDSSHNHPHTLMELDQAASMTHAILLDDSTHPGVQQSLKEFMAENTDWLKVDLASTVALLERHPYA